MPSRSSRQQNKPVPAAVPAPPRTSPWLFVLAAVASGCAWFLASPTYDLWPLAYLAALPLFFVIERAPTAKRAVLYGWIAGTVMNTGGFYWLALMLERFVPVSKWVSIIGLLFIAAAQGLGFALFAWLVRAIRTRTALPMALVAGLVVVPCELYTPALFRYYLALTQAWQPLVTQIADLGGVVAVSALVFAVNGAIWDVVTARRFRPAVATAVLVALCLGYGALRLSQIDAAQAAAPKMGVALLQGNVDFDQKGVENPELAPRQLQAMQDLAAQAEAQGAELAVWSETSFPYLLDRRISAEPYGRPFRGALPGTENDPKVTIPMILGAVTYDADARGGFDPQKPPYNTALYLDRDSRITRMYDKTELVLGSERLPLVETFPFLKRWLPDNAGRFTPGKGPVVFEHTTAAGQAVRLTTIICFEDIIPAFGRQAGALHPHLLVNITNDVWFGDTSGPWEHLALAIYRSIEQRTATVRAVNNGVSAYVDAAGRVVEHIPVRDTSKHPPAEMLLVHPPLLEGGHTVYAAVGDLFGWLATAFTLFAWLVLPRLKRRAAA
jgi:apolipoprotein N-acyltransferase